MIGRTRTVLRALLVCAALMDHATAAMQRLKVSDQNPHYLAYEDGTPFFYLGDTAWELFRRTTREEADRYLVTRRAQGFTVIMACGPGAEKTSGQLDTGIGLPNRYGHVPYVDEDFTQPRVTPGANNDYWDHVDYVIDRCEQLGLYVALLPYWARDYVPHPIDAETGYRIGRWYGQRYGDRAHIIWVLGGDNEGNNPTEIEIMDRTAQGLSDGAGRSHAHLFVTYHCNGWQDDPHSSGYYLHDKPWLDFNGVQSGHFRDGVQGPYFHPPYQTMMDDYRRVPVKPTVNLEAVYEGVYDAFDTSNPRLNEHDVRKTAYWTMLAGGAGYTYGNNNVWQFYSPRYEPRYHANAPWDSQMENASAHQMTHLKNLLLSRPYLARVPDRELLVDEVATKGDYKVAMRAGDGSYAMIYAPTPQPFVVKLSRLANTIDAWWYNPKTGHCADEDGQVTTRPFARYENIEARRFVPPTDNPDWVLVLDDASKGFPPPGQVSQVNAAQDM